MIAKTMKRTRFIYYLTLKKKIENYHTPKSFIHEVPIFFVLLIPIKIKESLKTAPKRYDFSSEYKTIYGTIELK